MYTDFMKELPMGFAMALANNTTAMEKFFAMSEAEKARVLSGVQGIGSKQQMRSYVDSMLTNSAP